MALRKPLVLNAGQVQQLQAGDVLDAAVSAIDVVSETNDNASPIVIGTPVYSKSDGDVDKARANASGTTRVEGLVRDASINAAAAGNIQTDGILAATTGEWDAITGGSGGLTPGGVYYLSAATAGLLTATAPTSVGQYVVEVGEAISSTEMLIRPRPPILL